MKKNLMYIMILSLFLAILPVSVSANSNLDIQLIYEMVLDYYKDRNPQRIKELLPEYIKLIRW